MFFAFFDRFRSTNHRWWFALAFFIIVGKGPQAVAQVDLSVPGSLQVMLGPEEAVAAGASWEIDLGSFPPGAVVDDLVPGKYAVRFQPLPGWIEPEAREIIVVGGATRSDSFEYQRIQSYYFRTVPPQFARPGSALRLVILSNDALDPQSPAPGANLTFAVSPQPAGAISFDPASGELRYEVAPQDRRDFAVTFSGAGPAGSVQGTFVISPAPALPPEDSVLSLEGPMPDPLSGDYIQINESKSPNAETFNFREGVHPRSISISGRVLLFEALSEISVLFDAYDGDDDIREMKLYAETIVIRSPLRLPGTRVLIHARELRFEGAGRIDVSPTDWFGGKADDCPLPDGTFAKSGVNGLASPPVEVYVERLHSDPDPQSPRFILHGGKAQDPGEGRNGRNILRPGTVFCGTSGGLPVIYSACILPDGSTDNECGSPSVSGEDAVPAGMPGRGGAGGTFTSPFGEEIASLLDVRGGEHGQKGQDTIGGAIGGLFAIETWRSDPRTGEPCAISGRTTTPAVRGFAGIAPSQPCVCAATRQKTAEEIEAECSLVGDQAIADCVDACASEGGDPRACARACRFAGTEGIEACMQNPGDYIQLEVCIETRCGPDPGRNVRSSNPGAWLHPNLVRSTLLFVKDAYLHERIPEAQAILEEYRDLIAALKSELPPGDEADQFSQLGDEIESLLHRMDSNLDYFGNPVTWVPLLSFEANLAAFTEEVDRAIPTLYLAYWVQVAATKARSVREGAIQAKDKLDKEIDTLILDHALAQEEMPVLLAEAEALEGKVAAVTATLAALEAQLVQRAQENVEDRTKLPFWKKAVGVLGAATKIVPLGQPALGYVGIGLGLLSKFDPDKPLANLDKVPDLVKALKANPYALCAKGKAEKSKEDPKKESKPTLMDRAVACKNILQAGVKEIREVLKDTKADKKDVDAELEKLRASDPIFIATTKEVAALNAEKQRLGERVAATLDRLTKFSSAVNENMLAIDQLDRDLQGALDVLDHRSILYVADMARRTTDRLLHYQYLLAKAYQFRTLRPYQGDLRLGRVLQRVRELVDFQDSEPVLSPDQFATLKAIYLEEVGRIAQDILDDLNENGPERSAPVSFRLTAEEVAALNAQGSIEIDLAQKGLFGANEDDLRIASIETGDLDTRVTGTIGTTATMRLRYEHSGYSRIFRNGKVYLFTHYRTERVNPITWSTFYDALSGTRTETTISAATESILRALLGLEDAEDILLFSPPGAMSRIVISKEVTADNGVDIDVEGLTLTLRYDFAQTQTGLRRLDVQVSDELGPRILLDTEDRNGRQDGLGGFVRSFSGPENVRLEAPLTHGVWAFDHWEIGGGSGISVVEMEDPIVDIALSSNVVARAVYMATVSTEGSTFRRGDTSGDSTLNLTDAVRLLGHLFLGDDAPSCPDAADADDNGTLNITDAIWILGYLFLGGAEPPAPGPDVCGVDPTSDGLAPCVISACN